MVTPANGGEEVPRAESPTVRRLMLGIRLRKLRTRAEVTADDAARSIARTDSTISRMETGQSSVPARVLERLLELYGATAEETEELTILAGQARQRGWWHRYGDVLPPGFGMYVGLEAEATELRGYGSEGIPGLLQTDAYARAVLFSEPRPPSDDEIEVRVAARLGRQSILTGDDPTHLWVVLNEAVLRRLVGGTDVMREQLEALAEKAALRNVTLQVMPFSRGAHPAMDGEFMIMTIDLGEAAASEYAYVEHRAGSLLMDKVAELDTYKLAFGHLCAEALDSNKSAAFIKKAAKELN
jgi:transcriptional regulator with XRE-family HTH domain